MIKKKMPRFTGQSAMNVPIGFPGMSDPQGSAITDPMGYPGAIHG